MAKSRRVIQYLLSLFLSLTFVSILIRQSGYSWSLPSFYPLQTSDSTSPPRPKYAFATFLSGSDADENEDGYFLGARHLVYSLLHHPTTKGSYPIPFIVLATPSVSATKRARLEADGATVVVADSIPLPAWIKPGADRWNDVATKLRLFAMVDYDKICFIDADQLVVAPLDGVFNDPAANITQTLRREDQVMADEPPLPSDYGFASRPDTFGADHAIPPDERDYLNAGFYVFQPSSLLFEYYLGLFQIENRFNGGFPEQDLFNYAHRRSGNMPWRPLQWTWNVNHPTFKDYEAGVKSFHAKYWDRTRPNNDPTLMQMWMENMEVMKEFYRERELKDLISHTVNYKRASRPTAGIVSSYRALHS